VRREATNQVAYLVDSKMNDFVLYKLPPQITKELESQLTTLFSAYANDLNTRLEAVARKTLENIVSEDQYHLVLNATIEAMKQKQSTELNRIMESVEQQINKSKRSIDDKVTETEKRCDTKIASLNDKLTQMDNLEKRIVDLEKKSWSHFLGITGSMLISALMIGAYIIIKK